LKNGKRDVIEKDYTESIVDGFDFELPSVDDHFAKLINDFDVNITGDGKSLDLSVDVGSNVYLQPHSNTIGSTADTTSLSKMGSGEQVPQNGSGLELMIIPITLLLFFKSLMQAFEKRGMSSGRLHARQWREIAA
jgi:hypothetical protein